MKFLTKLGQVVLEATKIILGFGPTVSMAIPSAAPAIAATTSDLSEIAQVIQTIEVAGQALSVAGPGKLTATTPLVAQVILQSAVLSGHSIDNPDLFKGGAQKIADGMADVLNSLKADIPTVSKT